MLVPLTTGLEDFSNRAALSDLRGKGEGERRDFVIGAWGGSQESMKVTLARMPNTEDMEPEEVTSCNQAEPPVER